MLQTVSLSYTQYLWKIRKTLYQFWVQVSANTKCACRLVQLTEYKQASPTCLCWHAPMHTPWNHINNTKKGENFLPAIEDFKYFSNFLAMCLYWNEQHLKNRGGKTYFASFIVKTGGAAPLCPCGIKPLIVAIIINFFKVWKVVVNGIESHE